MGGEIAAADSVEFDAVDIVTPSGMCLVRALTLSVPRGENLLITGVSCSRPDYLAYVGLSCFTPVDAHVGHVVTCLIAA